MNIEFKKYGKIGATRLMKIKVILNDSEIIYEGEVDDAPKDIKERFYYKVELVNRDAIYYVYDEDIAKKIMEKQSNNKE